MTLRKRERAQQLAKRQAEVQREAGPRLQHALFLEAQAEAAASAEVLRRRIRQLEAKLPDEAAAKAEIAHLHARCAEWEAVMGEQPEPEPREQAARAGRQLRAFQLLAEDEAKIADLEAALKDPAAPGIRAEIRVLEADLPQLERLASGEIA